VTVARTVRGERKRLSRSVIPLLTSEASLKRAIRRHFRSLGFVTRNGELMLNELNKDAIRELHRVHRRDKLLASKALLTRGSSLIQYIASGSDVVPDAIRPRLEVIDSKGWQSDLFAFASLYWSVPTSHGYGRRIRFLCWDDSNGKLLGLLALGDPVFNLAVRDSFIGWSGKDRVKRLACTMDAYVLGALPPYNTLLCGKLLACLLKSREVSAAFRKRYGNKRTIIASRKERRHLAMITTSSSLGRSSVYNRLKLEGEIFLCALGMTRGYGHFHVPHRLFNQMRAYLISLGHDYANGHRYGEGANWRMRVIREALTSLGLSPRLLRHGIGREVFACELAPNAGAYLRGEVKHLRRRALQSVGTISERALRRWVIPRSERDQSYRSWNREDFFAEIGAGCEPKAARHSEGVTGSAAEEADC